MTEATPATPPPPNPLLIQVPSAAGASEQQQQQQQPSSSEQSGFLLFKSWLSVMKSKGLDDGVVIISPPGSGGGQETKSLCGSPSYRYGDREEMLASQKQQILARFGQNLPGFGFTQSKNSCLFEDEEDDVEPPTSPYSYRHGNQVEYMGGPYGYVDPLFSHQLLPASSRGRRTTVRLEELDVVVQRQRITSEPASSSSRQEQPPPLLLLPTFVRSAESLVVLSKEHQRVDGNTSAAADRRLIVANGSD